MFVQTNLCRLGYPFGCLGSLFRSVLYRCWHSDFETVEGRRMVHLQYKQNNVHPEVMGPKKGGDGNQGVVERRIRSMPVILEEGRTNTYLVPLHELFHTRNVRTHKLPHRLVLSQEPRTSR